MSEERVAIVDLADELQVRKQRIFKILPRLEILPVLRREPSRRNQMVATVAMEEATAIRKELAGAAESGKRRSRINRRRVRLVFRGVLLLDPA